VRNGQRKIIIKIPLLDEAELYSIVGVPLLIEGGAMI
jgi:hypothetical protein